MKLILVLCGVQFSICALTEGTPTVQTIKKSDAETLKKLGIEVDVQANGTKTSITVEIKDTKKFRRARLEAVAATGNGDFRASWTVVPGTKLESQFTVPTSALTKCSLMFSTAMEGGMELELYDDVYFIALDSFVASPNPKKDRDKENKTPEGGHRPR